MFATMSLCQKIILKKKKFGGGGAVVMKGPIAIDFLKRCNYKSCFLLLTSEVKFT